MSLIGNLKAMTGGVSGLTSEVNRLDAAILKVGAHLTSKFADVNKSINAVGGQLDLGKGPAGNTLASSLASFSYATPQAMAGTYAGGFGGGGGVMGAVNMAHFGPTPELRMAGATSAYVAGRSNQAMGAAQMAMAPFTAAYGMTMDTNGIVNQAAQFFQATRRASAGANRAGIERASFSALAGGITSVGSLGATASILAGAGYTAGTTNYLGAMNQVRNAAISTGMQNEAAAGAIASMQSGGFAANAYQYGITTMNPNGSFKSVGDIATQVMNTFAPNVKGISVQTGRKITAQDINTSLLKGNLGPILEGLGLDANSQQLVVQAMIDKTNGKNPDRMSKKDMKGNENPLTAAFRMATSQTGIQLKSEKNTLTGLDAAAGTVETFNNALGGAISSLALFKSYLDGVSGTNVGNGLKAGGKSLRSGAAKFIGGAMVAGGIASLNPLVAGIGAGIMTLGGGGRPGYGSSFGKRNRGGGNPFSTVANSISALFGAKDSSGLWKSTGGTHVGTDFDVPEGTSVYAVKDGWVSGDSIDKDYGNAVLIDHPDGYQTLYAHLSNKEVSPGTAVIKGQEIGKSGKSGNVTGPHLHFEVRKGKNNPVDPSELTGASSPVMSATGMMNFTETSKGTKSSSSSSSANLTTGTGASDASASSMLAFLKGQGFSDNGAVGIVANLLGESGLRPNAVGDNGTSYGIAQWHAGRWDNLNKFAKSAGLDPSTIEAQSQFLLHELNNKGYSNLVSMLKDPNVSTFDATAAFLRKFERPADQSDSAVQSRLNRGLGALGVKGGGRPGYGGDLPAASSTMADSPSVNIGANGSKNVYITVKFDQANESNAMQFANKVQEILDSRNNNSIAGGS
jgi:murein DD-endopeptidase MepM/ murein hydrolase activator NlpD